eukprot:SAG31_NODE_721_length_12587_cov_5.502002_10_plen_156_part_00
MNHERHMLLRIRQLAGLVAPSTDRRPDRAARQRTKRFFSSMPVWLQCHRGCGCCRALSLLRRNGCIQWAQAAPGLSSWIEATVLRDAKELETWVRLVRACSMTMACEVAPISSGSWARLAGSPPRAPRGARRTRAPTPGMKLRSISAALLYMVYG